ncbi:hypothetical protein LMG3410_01573 [Achromobacter aegrifaciens]|nr:hypothetical protein MC81_32195 [Achromobacter insolitus]CAB3847081.1 hypothetical protein LMG3410_01573 [Achromobacter aegrifaciens]
MGIRFNIPGTGLVGPDTPTPAPRGMAPRPASQVNAPLVAPASSAERQPGRSTAGDALAKGPQTQSQPRVDDEAVPFDALEPPAWLDEVPLARSGDEESVGYWAGDVGQQESVAPQRRTLPRANPAEFEPEASLRYHQGAPEDLPLGSAYSERDWESVRAGADVRATAVEIDLGSGRALVSASWDEPGNEVLSVLGVDRIRLVAPEASSAPERASLGRIVLVADSDWVGRSIHNLGLPVGTTKVGNALVDDASGEVLGDAPTPVQSRLELARVARDVGAELLLYTTPKEWLSLRSQFYQEREQGWYDDRQAWPRQTPVAIIHRPLVVLGDDALSAAQLDWLAAAERDLGVIGPARPGARWTEGEAQAVMRWLDTERSRPENQGLDEVGRIRLEDIAIMKLADERARAAPAATVLIECLGALPAGELRTEEDQIAEARIPAYDRPRG